jgi:predicted glycosyltransferase
MKAAVTIQHPAHVHFYRPVIDALVAHGHDVAVFAREKDVALDLLDAYSIPHRVLARSAGSLPGLAAVQVAYELRLVRAVRRLDPDVVTAIGGMAAAHVSAVTGARSVVFTDTEVPSNRLVTPFADAICTPRNFDGDLGDGHVRYDGFHELAYLHPARFDPDPDVLRAHGVDPQSRFTVVRFSDMAAHHDVGETGLPPTARRDLVATLADHGSVFASVENGDPPDGCRDVPVPVHEIHHLLAFADAFVTDSATMATEAGVLGTPTVRTNSYVGDDDLGNFVELDRYGLVYSTPDPEDALALVAELVADPEQAARTWRDRRAEFLADKIDVARFAVDALVAAAEPDRDARDLAEVASRAR